MNLKAKAMELIPNFLETSTTEGSVTRARRLFLNRQIKALESQDKTLDDPTNLMDQIAFATFKGTLHGYIIKFKNELSNLHDAQDQYNS